MTTHTLTIRSDLPPKVKVTSGGSAVTVTVINAGNYSATLTDGTGYTIYADGVTSEAYLTSSGITYRLYSITCSTGTNPAAHVTSMAITGQAGNMTATFTWKYLTKCPACGSAYDAQSRYQIKADIDGKKAICEICGYDNYDQLFTET